MTRTLSVRLHQHGLAIMDDLSRADCETLRGIFGRTRYHWFPDHPGCSFLAFGGAQVLTSVGDGFSVCPFGFVPDSITVYRDGEKPVDYRRAEQ